MSSKPSGYTVELHGDRQEGHRLLQVPAAGSWRCERIDIGDKPTADHAAEIAEPLIEAYRKRDARERGPRAREVRQRAARPRRRPRGSCRSSRRTAEGHGAARDYILAPSAEAILEQLLPLYVRNMVYRGLVETAAAEHGARRTAMKNATDNAGDILEVLKRTYNRQRQARITQEIAEIVGGAAALQG